MSARHANAGFSLVEVACAILILGFALVALTEGITAALRSGKESELQTTAALIAAGQIETLRAEGGLTDGETAGEGLGDLSLYRWKQSSTPTSVDGLHEVVVVVENSKSGQVIYELRALLFELPGDTTLTSPSDRRAASRAKRREGRR
jgi:prepilin-type N-terminal cleavage/methylation domain-containing protein